MVKAQESSRKSDLHSMSERKQQSDPRMRFAFPARSRDFLTVFFFKENRTTFGDLRTRAELGG